MILRMTPILNPPQEGQENYYNYGFKTDITEQDVMETGVRQEWELSPMLIIMMIM